MSRTSDHKFHFGCPSVFSTFIFDWYCKDLRAQGSNRGFLNCGLPFMETALAEIWPALVSWYEYLPGDFDCSLRLTCGSPSSKESCAACCRWPCFGRMVGLDEPQRSLPTPTILWFCDSELVGPMSIVLRNVGPTQMVSAGVWVLVGSVIKKPKMNTEVKARRGILNSLQSAGPRKLNAVLSVPYWYFFPHSA